MKKLFDIFRKRKELTPHDTRNTKAATVQIQRPSRNPQESIALGIQFYQAIEEYRRARGDVWTWERYMPKEDFYCNGKYDPDLVCRTAGCWYRGTEDGRLRFYCNQNHTSHGGRPIW